MKNRNFVCFVLSVIVVLYSLPAWGVTVKGKPYQLLGNLWVSQIESHEKSVKGLHDALKQDIENLVSELKQKEAEVGQNPDCKSLDCKRVSEMVQAMYRLQDRAKMAWIMADVSRQWLSNYIDYGDTAMSAMRKGANTVQWADFLQSVAQSTADVAAAIAISLYTGDPSNLTESLQIIGSEIGNFGVNKAADLATGYQSATGAGGEKAAAYLGGETITRDVANNLASSLSGVGVFSASRDGMKYGFTPSARGLTRLKSAKGAVATMAVQAVLHALTAYSRGEVKKDLARVQKQLQQVMEEQTSLQIALMMQERNIEDMRKHHTEVSGLSAMLQNVRDACKAVGERKNCADKFKVAVDKAKADRQTKIDPLLKQRNAINQKHNRAREQYREDFKAVRKTDEVLRQIRVKLARAEILWKNRTTIEDLALHARSASKRFQYRKELDELHRLGNPVLYRKEVGRLSKARSDLWNRIEEDLKRNARLGKERLAVSAKANESIRAADEVFSMALSRAKDQLAVCTVPAASSVHRSRVSSDKIRELMGQKGAILPDQYYTLLEQAMKALDENLFRTHISIKISGECEEDIIVGGGETKNISGCWTDHKGRQIAIWQDGNRVAVDHPFYGRMFTGSLNGSNLVLRYLFRNTRDIAAVWKRTTGDAPPLKALNQVPTQSRYLGFDFEVTEEGKLRGVFRTLYVSYDRETGKLDYAETQSDPMEWLYRKVRLQSIRVTDRGFGRSLNQVRPGSIFQIAAKSTSGCATTRDRAIVTLYPEGKESEKIDVKLLETGPDTSEFHSVKAVSVASLKVKPGQKIIIRSGLRGTSVKVARTASAPISSSKTAQAGEATSEHNGSKKKHGNKTPLKQAEDKVTDGATSKTGGEGGGQAAIPVMGSSSRKHIGVPVKAPPARQETVKSVQWTAYRLESFTSMHTGGLPKMNVIKIAFRRGANIAQLHVKSYPVSLSRNDRTGEILWSVNWGSGDIVDQQMSSNPPAMDAVQQNAEGLRNGTVKKSGLAALINGLLGAKARHL